MKLDAETLRKLALAGAKNRLRELDSEAEKLREVIRQLTGAAIPADGRRKVKEPGRPKRRPRRVHSEKFKAQVVKEAREADNASAVGKRHSISPSLVRLWMEKAK